MWVSKITKFAWAAIFSFIYIVFVLFVISTALMFIQNPDFIGVTFPERAIADAARVTRGSQSEIDGECSMKGSYFDKQVTCEMRRMQGNKITDTVLLEYRVMFDTITSFHDVRENFQ
ncbi:hypothetical protein CO659_21540 [Rhizobium sp. S9]|nr:hypothetical protein CO659_21540 [Rhizobium sp. S9]